MDGSFGKRAVVSRKWDVGGEDGAVELVFLDDSEASKRVR